MLEGSKTWSFRGNKHWGRWYEDQRGTGGDRELQSLKNCEKVTDLLWWLIIHSQRGIVLSAQDWQCFIKEQSWRSFSVTESLSEGHTVMKYWDELQFPLAVMVNLLEYSFICTQDLNRLARLTYWFIFFPQIAQLALRPSSGKSPGRSKGLPFQRDRGGPWWRCSWEPSEQQRFLGVFSRSVSSHISISRQHSDCTAQTVKTFVPQNALISLKDCNSASRSKSFALHSKGWE